MSGYDIQYWFSDLWYDLTHIGTADLPSVAFKLFLIFIGFVFAKGLFSILWRVLYVEFLGRILEPLFKVVFFPLRIPSILIKRARRRKSDRESDARNKVYEQNRIAAEQQKRADDFALEQQREQEHIAEMIRLQNETRIR
ncbi:MAG: hypothetical protein ACPGVN_07575 [Alphaproteobacteria bacterium]